MGDLAEQLPPVVGLTIADMQGAHLVEPLWIVPLHLVEVDGTGARKSPGLQAIEVFAADPVGGTRMTSAPAKPGWRSASSKAIWPPSL